MKKVSTFLFVSSALLFDVTVSANDGWATFGPIEPSAPSTHMNQADQCANYTRNIDIAYTPDNGCTHLIAQKQIRLLPGFRFKATDAQSGNTFSARIDQGLICPPTHGLTKMSDGTLSSGEGGFAVGSIPYEYSVSNTGAAVYSIPIECPKGINGMEPKISLVYNSQARDGIMGWGWSIGGLSAITRVNKNLHFDGKTEGVSFTSDDALAIDGQRLLKYANEDGGIWYKTEADNFSKIVAYDIQPWGPKYFKVYTKNGLTMTYGSKSGDLSGYYILSKESDYIYNIAWYLTEVVDSNGNQILYKYEAQQKLTYYKNNRIRQIVYGKNENTNSGVETTINFQYNEGITQPVPTYINGKKTLFNACLSSIQIINEGAVQSTYSIKYDTYENKKHVTEIGYERNGAMIGSTKFVWSKTKYARTLKGMLHLPLEQSDKIQRFNYDRIHIITKAFGDIDGDGLSDLFIICQLWNKIKSNFVCMLLHNTGSGYEITEELAFDNMSDIATYYFYDDDNDGADEFFMAYKRDGAFDVQRFKWQSKHRSVDSDIFKVRHSGKKNSSTPIVGDFYGNGSVQIITKSEKRSGNRITETHFVNTENAPSVRYIPKIEDWCKIFVTDINGNGKSDLTIVTSGGAATVFEEDNGCFAPIKYDKQSSFSIIAVQSIMSFKELGFCANDNIYQGDFNGDGNTDLLVCKSDSKKWILYISDGTGYVNCGSDLPLMNNCKYHERVYVSDVNADGKSDLIVKEELCDVCADYYYENSSGVITLPYEVLSKRGRILISTGTNFEEALTFNPDNFEGASLAGYVCDRENEEYIGYCNKSSNNLGRNSFTTSEGPDKIISATDGMGKTLELSYSSIGDRSMETQTYQIGSKDEDDVSVLNRCQWDVVNSAKLQSEGKTLSSYEYSYTNAYFDKKGKGFLGYKKTAINNNTKKTLTTTEYSIDKQYKCVYPVRQTITTNGELIKEINNAYELKRNVDKGYYILPKKITENDILNGLQTVTDFIKYDSYGNLLNKIVKRGDLTVTENVTYTQAGYWCPRLPSCIKTTRAYKGNSESDAKHLSYDNQGNLISEDDSFVTTRYSNFDSFGHAQTISYTADGKTRTEKVTYTPSGRNIATKTNILNETTTYEWNESDGTLTSETDHYGRKTIYRYDGLGRRIETIYPDGRRCVTTLLWVKKGNPIGASYYQYSETSGLSPEYVWFTSDGKEICRQCYGLGGKLISVFREYNSDGTVRRVSEPTFAGKAEKWETQYNYDINQRPIQITTPSGITTIQYSGRTTTTISPTTKVEQTLGAEGWKESIITNGKTVSYTYYPSGLVKSATPEGGKAVELKYNKQGKRTQLADPDGGTIDETYNAFGELTSSERDISEDRRIKTTYTYRDNGQLIQKNIGGDIIRYTYDSNNRLQYKDYGNLHSVEYQYDSFDRIVESKEVIEGKEYLSKTNYDLYGRVKERVFPTGYTVTNHYDDYGNFISQTDIYGNRVYEALTADAKGRMLSESRNNKLTEYSYDDKDNLISIRTDGVVELQYTYSKDKNLPFTISDRYSGYRQEYYYDDQNRLINWPIFRITEGSPIQTNYLEYDCNNNISNRSAFGKCDIEYKNDEHPHAISSINGVPDAMPKTDLNVSYTNFSKVEQIDEGANHYTIVYGVDQNRVKSILKTTAGETTRYYLPNYEEVITPLGASEKIHYLCGGAVMVEKGGQWNLYYCYGDRLGSIVAVTDKEGNVLERYAYTPWGERRDPSDWTKPDGRTEFFNNRGFTGHEHLDTFNLIDMGGRMYDPMLGTFLSIDPYIQAPDRWLNYNRYLYCYGNPLSYTDPSGEFIISSLVVGVAIGVTLGALSGVIVGRCNGVSGGKLVLYGLVGGIAGGVAGAVGGLVSSAIAATSLSGTFLGGAIIGGAAGLTNGLISGYGFARLGGSSVGQALLSGLKSGAIGLASGAIICGATQGISNVHHGRNFWTGKAIEPVPQTSNSASSAASQSTEISSDEYTAECTDTPKNLPAKYWPENNGFVEHSVSDNYLMPGDIIDRYGGTYDKSRFFGRVGDLPLERSLPYEHQNSNASYEMFIVTKPIPVKSGTVAPWFCQPGGGRQYLMPIDFQYLRSHGFIIRF